MKTNKNKTTRPKPIKSFKNLDAEAHFWDTHDVSMLLKDSKTPLRKIPLLKSEKDAILTIRIQKSVKDNIEKIAQAKGINPTTLARMWIVEKLFQVE